MGIETAALATILSATAAATAVGGTAYSMVQGAEAQKMQEKQAKLARQAQELQTARQRSDVIRQARISQAQVQQAGANQGVAGSSMAAGGQASIQSQMNSNLSFIDQMRAASIRIGNAETAANQAAYNAQLGQQIAGAGFWAYGKSDKIAGTANKAWGKIFG